MKVGGLFPKLLVSTNNRNSILGREKLLFVSVFCDATRKPRITKFLTRTLLHRVGQFHPLLHSTNEVLHPE
jgi:hypothetical protein